MLEEATDLFRESLLTTLGYGGTAAITALLLSYLLALLLPQKLHLPMASLLLVSLSVPSAVSALGLVLIGSHAPPAMDWFFRGEAIVGIALGLRLSGVAFLFLLAARSAITRSARLVSTTFDLSVPSKCWHFKLLPHLIPGVLTAVLLVLVALSDVSAIALLQPPGGASFGSHLFAVMDAASEKVVASLCLVYLSVPFLLFLLSGGLVPALKRR